MKKLLVLLLLFLGMSCQKAELIENHDSDEGRGSKKEASDTIDVDVDAVPDGWAGSIDVGFEFG